MKIETDPDRMHPLARGDMSRMVHFDELPAIVQEDVNDMPVWHTDQRPARTHFMPKRQGVEDEYQFCELDIGMAECILGLMRPTDTEPTGRQWPNPGSGFESLKESHLRLRIDEEYEIYPEEWPALLADNTITIYRLRACMLALPEGAQKLIDLFPDVLSVRLATYDQDDLNSYAPQLAGIDVVKVVDAIDLENSSFTLENLGNGFFRLSQFTQMHLNPQKTHGLTLFRPWYDRYRILIAKQYLPELTAISPNIRAKSLVSPHLEHETVRIWSAFGST